MRRIAMLAAAALTLAACQDTTDPTAGRDGSGAPQFAASSQDRLERATHAAMPVQGAVFVDDDERIGKLVIGVQNASAARGVRAAMAAAGFAASSYEVIQHEPIVQVKTLRDQFRPTEGGIQIHFGQYVCTLGFNATEVSSGQRSFITNSHCTDRQGGVESTAYYQPTSSTSAQIATEVEDPDYFKGGVCPRGKKCRYSDSSRALYDGATSSSLGAVAQTTGANNGDLTVVGTISLSGKGSAGVGEVVNKIGRTTGWTRGQVTRTCVNTGVSGSQIMQLCQNFVDAGVDGGDSGSQVFNESNQLVGILWGGSGTTTYVYSPLDQIEQELGSLTVN